MRHTLPETIFGFQYSFGLGDVSREGDHLELSDGGSMTDMIVGEVRTRYFGGAPTLEASLEATSVDLGNDV